MNQFYKIALLTSAFFASIPSGSSAWAAEPGPTSEATLTIDSGSRKVIFTKTDLEKMAEPEALVVEQDAAYQNTKQTYKVVKATRLFEKLKISKDSIVQFYCLDGFSAPLNSARLLESNPTSSVAYIAIEDPKSPWKPVKAPSSASAGPFYLVWKNPAASHVGPEEWPYQLAGFRIKSSLRESFPNIFPTQDATAPVQKGFAVFTKNCFACHTLNGQGESEMGPDLNVPHNPTEYLNEKHFRILVRNPQDLRHWPQSKMLGFGKDALSDEDISNLLAFLKHMAKHKVTPK